jgi:DNA replicative helicase MCM subunit Mcm2 (Cdc46/Mcm family)
MFKLAEEILDNRLSKYKDNCPKNITDLFFIEIEKDEKLLKEYNALAKMKDKHTLNSQLGKVITKYWNLKNKGECSKPKSSLINYYEKHSN